MMKFHPQLDDNGRGVKIASPHSSTGSNTWTNPSAHATIAAGDPMPHHELNGIKLGPAAVPKDWSKAGNKEVHEPPLNNRSGKPVSTGIIMHEPDGRVWVNHPTNAFGGYEASFPKGRVEKGLTMQQNAMKEAHEETGLKARIVSHAADVERSTTYTRYYHGVREGGTPQHMGWESQAMSLVPKNNLHKVVNHPNDAKIVEAAKSFKEQG